MYYDVQTTDICIFCFYLRNIIKRKCPLYGLCMCSHRTAGRHRPSSCSLSPSSPSVSSGLTVSLLCSHSHLLSEPPPTNPALEPSPKVFSWCTPQFLSFISLCCYFTRSVTGYQLWSRFAAASFTITTHSLFGMQISCGTHLIRKLSKIFDSMCLLCVKLKSQYDAAVFRVPIKICLS